MWLRSFISAIYPEPNPPLSERKDAGSVVGPLFDLAPEWVCHAAPLTRNARWSLTPPFHPYRRLTGAVRFLWHFPLMPMWQHPPGFNNRASCPMESGLSSPETNQERPVTSYSRYRKMVLTCTGGVRTFGRGSAPGPGAPSGRPRGAGEGCTPCTRRPPATAPRQANGS